MAIMAGAGVAIAVLPDVTKASSSDLNSKAASPSATDVEPRRSLLSAEQAKTITVIAAARNRVNIRMFITSANSGIRSVINDAAAHKKVALGS